jgi:PAS domain S-box-containing protein
MEWRDQAELYRADDRQIIESGRSKSFTEEPQTTPEGDTITLLTSKIPLRGSKGEISGVLGTYVDITERKRAEEALRESEERFSGAFEHAPIGVALVLPDGRWFKVNRALCELVGYSEAELLTRTFQDITHSEDLEADLENVRRLLDGEIRSYQMEKRYVHKRGHLVTVLLDVSLVRDGQGQPRYFIAQIQDITERKRAEEALRASEEQLRAVFDLASVGIAQADPRIGRWLRVNQKMCEITGYSVGELLQMRIADITHPEDRQSDREAFERVVRGEAPDYRIEKRYIRKDGALAWVNVNMTIIRDAAGQPTRTVAAIEDITERKQIEAQLFQSQKLETVGKLAGGIAHEFNSILTAIIGQSELLLGELPAGSPLTKNAIEISKAAEQAATLTRQLLAYGRKQILQPEILDLNSVLAGMESTLRHLLGRSADVRIAPSTGLKAVKADAGQIEQVIINMAMNAADAMPHGGTLTLETANVTLDQESVSRFPELKTGDYVMLAITDTGTGMTEEAKARVFEPFSSTKGVGQGTGLRLSTCYGIIKQSGGHISVYSELARGTTFKIYLPPVEQQTKMPLPRLDSPDLPRGTEAILLVEDDPALREMAATLLRRLGYTVLAAANGIEVLSPKQQRDIGHFDLLFTDVVMPHMNGKELSERVRVLSPHTRILFTSAYTENAIVHQGVLAKGVAFLQKPFTPSALAHKVREILDNGKA